MFRIGEFSRIARVSCRLLRYYDELGLLSPRQVDEATGYRFYSAAQLPELNRILVLKHLGISLEQIAKIVAGGISTEELRGMLLLRQAEVERTLSTERSRLRQIETRLAQLDEAGRLIADDVVVRSEPSQRILSVRLQVGSFDAARAQLAGVLATLEKKPGKAALGSPVVIAHADFFEPDDLDLEFGAYLRQSADVDAVELSEGRQAVVRVLPREEHVAACVRVGPPEIAHRTTAQIGRYVEDNGFRLAGPSREVFLKMPAPDRMQEAVVEMQFPIERV